MVGLGGVPDSAGSGNISLLNSPSQCRDGYTAHTVQSTCAGHQRPQRTAWIPRSTVVCKPAAELVHPLAAVRLLLKHKASTSDLPFRT